MVCGLAACGGGGSSASGSTSGGSAGGSTSGGTTSGGTTTGTSGGGTLGGLAGGGTTGGGSTTGGTTTGGTTSGGTTSGGSATGDAGSDARLALINPVNGFQNPVPAITYTRVFDGTTQVRIASGTTAQSATILANGRSRRYVVISPVAGQANAPMLLLLHPSGTSPETTAELTRISEFVQTQGFLAVLPEAQSGGWQDDPAAASNEDVPFLRQLIEAFTANGLADRTRVYAAGFSNGGFMVERLSCELADRIAAFGIDAATLRSSQVNSCFPVQQRAKVYFLGTSDLIVPYSGVFGGLSGGVRSAADTMSFWKNQQQCGFPAVTDLPDRIADGTTVTLSDYGVCTAGTRLKLYTINGGGHAWPGGESTLFGATTQDISASGLIWRFVAGYRR